MHSALIPPDSLAVWLTKLVEIPMLTTLNTHCMLDFYICITEHFKTSWFVEPNSFHRSRPLIGISTGKANTRAFKLFFKRMIEQIFKLHFQWSENEMGWQLFIKKSLIFWLYQSVFKKILVYNFQKIVNFLKLKYLDLFIPWYLFWLNKPSL